MNITITLIYGNISTQDYDNAESGLEHRSLSTPHSRSAKVMEQQETNKSIFPRLIISYVLVGLIGLVAASFAIYRIDTELDAKPIIYEQALFDLHVINSLSDQGAQNLFGYLLNGIEKELTNYRKVVENLPARFDAFTSSTLLSTPGEQAQRELFEIIEQSWEKFTSDAEVTIREFQRNGRVSTANL